ncbi:hypothetical protein M9H77_18656 [Catharanthus roseus]|uniref:Uncharacterized protein n=1 Tax=Catharanthus roseus TaxID=4058 RepID=A0ACC0B8C4_CATRO|nr:hypothetical protein M9H77_18656 [Catharanthus roseus]
MNFVFHLSTFDHCFSLHQDSRVMEEDRSWMYRRTVPGVMRISSEFQLGVKRLHMENCRWVTDRLLGKVVLQEMLKATLTMREVHNEIKVAFSNASNSECLKSLSWGPSKRMVRGSKKRAHQAAGSTPMAFTSIEMASTLASIPLRTSLSLVAASIPPGTSTPPVAASIPLVTLTPFP